MFNLVLGAVVAFVAAAILGVVLIPVLHRLKFGQEIREEGPKWHAKKSGTPTMGGFIFIAATVLAVAVSYALAIWGIVDIAISSEILMLLVISLVFGIIGFIDDYIKVILKRNLGLTAKQKFLLQLVAAIGFVCWAVYGEGISTAVKVPFTAFEFDMGFWFIPFATVVILATVNSVNLTDGLDGLATCITIVVALFFMLFAEFGAFPNSAVALFAAILCGGLIGFLLYNKYPAKVFMGDTGSLFLGGVVVALAFSIGRPILLILAGIVYIAEAFSVILQVAYYKKTKKRLFKMAPIHHHFELCGYGEQKIVLLFSAVTAVGCFIALLPIIF